jgi:stage III sporulation protein AD
MELALKAALLGAIAAAGALVIKKSSPEIALIMAFAVVVCIFAAAARLFGAILDTVKAAEKMSGLSAAVFTPLLKCVGIGVAAKICADICRDASESAIASAVELAGAFAALYTALPLIRSLMTMIGGMI